MHVLNFFYPVGEFSLNIIHKFSEDSRYVNSFYQTMFLMYECSTPFSEEGGGGVFADV